MATFAIDTPPQALALTSLARVVGGEGIVRLTDEGEVKGVLGQCE
jgi:hypothetical protein